MTAPTVQEGAPGPGPKRWIYTRCAHCGQKRKTRAPRRVECKGNCGRWWYSARGRTREWCERCYPIHRSAMRNGRAWPAHREMGS